MMRLSSLRAVPGRSVSVLLTFLLLFGFSNSSPTGLVVRADSKNSETICFWDRPQSTIFRDTIYIDGGYMMRVVTQNGDTKQLTNGTHLLYSVNLTYSFSIDDDQFSILRNESKPSGNMGTDFTDGFMLANDYEFIVYGGYMEYVDADVLINDKWSLARYMVQNGATPLNNPGEFELRGLSGVTRYIASAGSVNVPSENKAFVFSGATGPNWGEFYSPKSATTDTMPYGNSSNLISVDLSVMESETWENVTLPSSISARKSSELVWLPVGAQGMLVAIGGSVNRERYPLRKDLTEESQTKGQEFVDNVHLFDIANNKWYTQKTFGITLPPTSEFCTVVASSSDNKTHQIYVYGGHEDISDYPLYMKPVSANVYVLSIPSFTWTKVYDGTDQSHARKGHRCHKVADNLMMSIGGRPETNSYQCLNGGLIRIFNLNTLEWEDKYDPTVHDTYKVPEVLQKVIGGNEAGGSTLQAEKWSDDDIKGLFDVPYTKTIPTYWPYTPAASNTISGIPSATLYTPAPSSSSGMPSYVPPLLGAILGLLGLITVLCAVLFWLRRKKQQRKAGQSDSAASTVRRNRQTWSWLLGVYGDEKRGFDDPTPSSEGPNPFDHHSALVSPMTDVSQNPMDAVIVEAQGRQVYEMPDSSQPQELYSSPVNTTKKVTINNEVTELGGESRPRPEVLDNNTPISSVRREEARHERGIDPQVLQRLLHDPSANLHDD